MTAIIIQAKGLVSIALLAFCVMCSAEAKDSPLVSQVVSIQTHASNSSVVVAFSPDGTLLATGGGIDASLGSYGEMKIWDWRRSRMLHHLKDHGGTVEALAFSADGEWLVGGGYRPKIWDVQKGTLIRKLKHDGFLVHSLVITPDKKNIITASQGTPYAVVWDAKTGEESQKLFANQPRGKSLDDREQTVYSIALNEAKAIIAMSGRKQPVSIWSTKNWNFLHEVKETTPDWYGQFTAISPDGNTIFCGEKSDDVGRFVQIETGKEVLSLRKGERAIDAAAFSPSGRLLATAGWVDVCLWDVKSGELLWSQKGKFTSVAFSKNGHHLAAGTENGMAFVFEVTNLSAR